MRRRSMALAAVGAAGLQLALACGWDWTFSPHTDADADVADSSGVVADAPADIDAAAANSDAAGTCDPEKRCSPGQYCDYPDGLCGQAAKGHCVPVLPLCNRPDASAVCGCSGEAHLNACYAASEGDDLAPFAKCSPATFACRELQCSTKFEYCSLRARAECLPFQNCFLGDCSCLDAGPCECLKQKDGGVVVTCP